MIDCVCVSAAEMMSAERIKREPTDEEPELQLGKWQSVLGMH